MTEALSPLDGRYKDKINDLASIFSEAALIRYRYHIELSYFRFITQLLNINEKIPDLEVDIKRVKEIESVTRHDVKAIEYHLREQLQDKVSTRALEHIHFGLTSQDINSVAYVMQLRDFIEGPFLNDMRQLSRELHDLGDRYKDIPMLCRTHGQAATPTTVGIQFRMFADRLDKQVYTRTTQYKSKFGGATGNLNGHFISYPDIDWHTMMDIFIKETFNLTRHRYTKQIDHYDHYAITFDMIRRVATVLIDLCQDMWLYISHDYFKLKTKDGEVGSSTMPHKVNPINFENAEGNLQLASALLNFLSTKLPISRMQRDLTDSTVLRNLGTTFGHVMLGIRNIFTGLSKIEINKEALKQDLDNNWQVVTEAIQIILRREGIKDGYDLIKKHSWGCKMEKKDIHHLIDQLPITYQVKDELKKITPHNYLGREI